MKNFLVIFLVIIFSSRLCALANPPSEIELQYDEEHQSLTMNIFHVSDNVRDHFIRRFIISKNDGQDIKAFTFAMQKPKGLFKTVIYEAKEGDVINVKAICSQAGILETSMTVKKNQVDDEQKFKEQTQADEKKKEIKN